MRETERERQKEKQWATNIGSLMHISKQKMEKIFSSEAKSDQLINVSSADLSSNGGKQLAPK